MPGKWKKNQQQIKRPKSKYYAKELAMKSDHKWWQTGVIYQIYPHSFRDTSGNGIGDLRGIIDNLDYLNDGTPESLGVDAIWISPFYPSPMADFGYDVADYCDVAPLFGDLEKFDQLLNEAHRRNIKVIIDFVPNHSSNQHAWFQESISNKDNPKRNWYIWRDPNPGGGCPNNWGNVFGGPAWEWDRSTGQYYFHQFLKEQPDLNWRNPEVRVAMMDVLRFWLERGVDGFRMDVVGMILKDPEMRDNPPNPKVDPNLPQNDIYGRQLNIYNQDQDDVHEILREFRVLLDGYGDRFAIGELWYELPRWVKYYGEETADSVGDGLHLPFNFRLKDQQWIARDIRASIDELEAALPSFAWPNYVLGNHDSPRLASNIGREQARVAAMLLLTLRGTPTLYYGDELGLTNGIIPKNKVQDPQGLRLGADRTRDIARTPMQWSDEPFAGFSSEEPWLPLSQDHETLNAALQEKDPSSMLMLYRYLIWMRKALPALHRGNYYPLDTNCDDCFIYMREYASERYLIALNFTGIGRTVIIPGIPVGTIVLSTYLDREETTSLSKLGLRPNEGVIIRVTR
jgi:alpha-glucosidase